jgi:hypothetical protein
MLMASTYLQSILRTMRTTHGPVIAQARAWEVAKVDAARTATAADWNMEFPAAVVACVT